MSDHHNGTQVLAAASILAAVLGSVHAFSVFLEPLEARFAASRASVSLTYSLALVSITVAVLGGYLIYDRFSPSRLFMVACTMAASGAAVAAMASALWGVWLGYSLLFGGANGLGYGYGLQLAARANPGREGMAMGTVTAAYALGAAVAPWSFAHALVQGGFGSAMLTLCVMLIVTAPICITLLRRSGFDWQAAEAHDRVATTQKLPVVLTWLSYGCGVAAGLMAIGHAAGVAGAAGVNQTWIAPAAIAIFNFLGALAAGRLADRFAPRSLLTTLPLISAAALFLLAISPRQALLIAGLCAIGFAYGGIIAAYPAAIAKATGPQDSARIYGQVFTAWGLAGFLAPWGAGLLFDQTGGYRVALATAAILGLFSSMLARVAFTK